MTIYRILAKTPWGGHDTNQGSDQFVDAENKDEAKKQFKPQGTTNVIDSVTETSFEKVDDLKLYLVGLAPHWYSGEHGSHYFAVQAINGSHAEKMIEEREVGKHGTADTISDVKYIGKIDKDITEVL